MILDYVIESIHSHLLYMYIFIILFNEIYFYSILLFIYFTILLNSTLLFTPNS